jgi:hypothetical protein
MTKLSKNKRTPNRPGKPKLVVENRRPAWYDDGNASDAFKAEFADNPPALKPVHNGAVGRYFAEFSKRTPPLPGKNPPAVRLEYVRDDSAPDGRRIVEVPLSRR